MTGPEQVAPNPSFGQDSGIVIGRPPAATAPSLPLAAPVVSPATEPATEAETKPAIAAVSAPDAAAVAVAAPFASAAAQVAPTQLSRARAIPDAGRQDPPGTPEEELATGPRPAGMTGRLARLRIGSHMVSRSALSQLRVSSYSAGLILGADQHQRPVPVRLFRSQPTRVALVGGPWASQLMAFRAFALGAQVTVITTDPDTWHGFGERATGRGDRFTLMTAQRPLDRAASAQQPVLVIYDLGPAGATTPEPLGPWQTEVTVLRQLEPSGRPLVQGADLVLLQRLAAEEARVAGPALSLRTPSTQFLQVMADDMIALVADGGDRYIWFAQTALERDHTGAPRR